MYKTLFCLDSDSISGGIKLCREMMQLLKTDGQDVQYFVWNERRKFDGWSGLPFERVEKIEDIARNNYDFVVFSNAYLVPVILPFTGDAHPVLYYMAHESYHYGSTFAECMSESDAFLNVLRLPISVISISEALKTLLKKQVGRESFYVPVGPDQSVFTAKNTAARGAARKRILLVGDYNLVWKGMKVALDAVQMLSRDMDVELVMLTQGKQGRKLFDNYNFPVEFRYRPALSSIPDIYSSCHVYCCSSFHEGLGLAALEAFSCGVPAVCTRNHGVDDYGIDNETLLLAEPNDAQDLSSKLRMLLSDEALAERLRANALNHVQRYQPHESLRAWKAAQRKILETPAPAVDTNEMKKLNAALEADGMFTPLSTFDALQRLNGAIDTVCDDLLGLRVTPAVGAQKLSAIKNELKQYTGKTSTQYFKSFKSGYDLCQLLIAFQDTPEFLKYVSTLSGRNK